MADNPHQNVTFPSNGGEAHGYLAVPDGGSGPGLVVIQEWWGLTSHIKSLADRFAAEGFVALAPDLYGGATTHDAGEAQKLMQQLPESQAVTELAGAVDYLLSRPETTGKAVGAIGFCMGGGFVLQLAAEQGAKVNAAVAFYGVLQSEPDFSRLTAAVQGHFGEKDDFVPLEKVREVEGLIAQQSGKEAEIHLYPAAHAFLNDENLLGTYDPEQAGIAWGRAVSFLHHQAG